MSGKVKFKTYLERRDPNGYYVIPAKAEALKFIERFEGEKQVETVGDIVYVRVKSRSLALEILKALNSKGLLV